MHGHKTADEICQRKFGHVQGVKEIIIKHRCIRAS